MHAEWGMEPAWSSQGQKQLLAASGARTVRIDCDWGLMEKTAKGVYQTYYLNNVDHAVDEFYSMGLKVLIIVGYTPAWAGGTGTGYPLRGAPTNPQDFLDYCLFIAGRYGNKIESMEIQNEASYWGWTAAQYAATCNYIYPRLKAAYPNLIITAGGCTGADSWDGALGDTWFSALYRSGFRWKASCDAFSMHGYWVSPHDWTSYYSDAQAYWNDAHHESGVYSAFYERAWKVFNNYGDGDMPIWWTETGLSSYDETSTRTGPDFVNQAFDQWALHLPSMKRIYWYMLFDSDVGATADRESNYGTVNQPVAGTWTPKPMYYTFRDRSNGLVI